MNKRETFYIFIIVALILFIYIEIKQREDGTYEFVVEESRIIGKDYEEYNRTLKVKSKPEIHQIILKESVNKEQLLRQFPEEIKSQKELIDDITERVISIEKEFEKKENEKQNQVSDSSVNAGKNVHIGNVVNNNYNQENNEKT